MHLSKLHISEHFSHCQACGRHKSLCASTGCCVFDKQRQAGAHKFLSVPCSHSCSCPCPVLHPCRKVYMGHIALREALQLVCHYFGDLTPQQQDNFQSVWLDGCVSPAALEALCAECEDVDSLLQGVTVLVQHSDAAVASASAGACADSTDAAGAASGSQLSHDQQTPQEVPDQDSSSGSSGSNGGNGSSGSNGSSAGGCDVATEPEGLWAPAGNAAVSAESPCGSIQGCSGDSDCRVFIDAAGCSKLGGDHLLRWAVS